MVFENIIREMDKIRNEEDMALSFNFDPKNVNEYGRHTELKEQALKNTRTTAEYKEVEEAIRMAGIERRMNNDNEIKQMKRSELTAELSPILEKDYQEAINQYTTLTTEYKEKLREFQKQLNALLENSINSLLPITKELASIEKANDYLFYSKGTDLYSMATGITALIDTNVKPIPKIEKEATKPQKIQTMGEYGAKEVYPFLNRIDTKEALTELLVEGVNEHE